MRHEGMLEKLDEALTLDDIQTDRIKQNSIGKIIEKQAPHHLHEGSKRYYHAISRDWVTGEIFRRVEPEGRTMGEYFENVLRPKLGNIGVHVKVDPSQFD